MLRNEPGIYYEDLYPLIAFLPRYAYASDGTDPNDLLPLWQASHNKNVAPLKRVETRSSSLSTTLEDVDERTWSISFRPRGRRQFYPEQVLPIVYTDHPLRPSRLPPKAGFFDYFPILRPIKRIPKFFKPTTVIDSDEELLIQPRRFRNWDYIRRKKMEPVDSNVPLQVMLYINSYNGFLQKKGLLSAPAGAALTATINSLQDAISGLDRIKTTPLPFAYQAHLRLTVWYEPSSLLLRCERNPLIYPLQALPPLPSCTFHYGCEELVAFRFIHTNALVPTLGQHGLPDHRVSFSPCYRHKDTDQSQTGRQRFLRFFCSVSLKLDRKCEVTPDVAILVQAELTNS